MMQGYKIEVNIYAEDSAEAERGRAALVAFIEMMRQNGAAVRGDKLHEAVNTLQRNAFAKSQITNFFRK